MSAADLLGLDDPVLESVDPSDTVSAVKTNSRAVLEHRSQLFRGWTSGCVTVVRDRDTFLTEHTSQWTDEIRLGILELWIQWAQYPWFHKMGGPNKKLVVETIEDLLRSAVSKRRKGETFLYSNGDW